MVWWKFLVVNNSDLIHPVYILLFAQSFLGDQTKGHSPMRRLNIHSNVTGRQVSIQPRPQSPLRRTHPALSAHTQLNFTPPPPPPLPTSAPAPLPHIFSLLFKLKFNCERVGYTLKLASCHSQVLSDEIQVDNCGCACSRPIGGESWRSTMYFCTSSLLCLMISVNSTKLYFRAQVQRKNSK